MFRKPDERPSARRPPGAAPAPRSFWPRSSAKGADPLAEAVRAPRRRDSCGPAGLAAGLPVGAEATLPPLDPLTDEAGRSLFVERLVALKDWARPLLCRRSHQLSRHRGRTIRRRDPAFGEHNEVDHIVVGARGSSALRRHLGAFPPRS